MTERNAVIRVVSVGPTGKQSGGIAAVVAELEEFSRADDAGVDLSIVDSGGVGPSVVSRAAVFAHGLWRLAWIRGDVAHLHVASSGSTWRKIAFAVVCACRSLPFIIHLHGAAYPAFVRSQSNRRTALIRAFFRAASSVVVLGDYWATFVLSELGVREERVHVVHNGVAPPARKAVVSGLHPAQDSQRPIVFLGRVEQLKGVVDIVAAWRRLELSPVSFVLAGPPSSRETVELVKRTMHDSGGRFRYLGHVSRDESWRLIEQAWVVILPSYAEGLPVALIEAMSLGVPCIATGVGAVSELIDDGVNGFMIEPGDVDALVEHIDLLYKDEALRDSMGQAARRKWKAGFDRKSMWSGLNEVWRSVADD